MLNNRSATPLSIAITCLAAMLVYSQVINHAFVWDTNHIFSNEALRSVSVDNIIWMLGNPVIGNWHPLSWLSHMIDYSLFGDAAGYHHLVNLAFHIVNSVLVFFLARKLCAFSSLGNAAVIALLCALVFTVHPLRVESVAWVAARKDLLYSLFYLLSISFYIQHREGNQYAYFISIMAFLASLLSKSMAVTLPAVLILLDVYLSHESKFMRKITDTLKHRLLDKIPYLLFTLIISIVTLFTQGEALGEDKFTLIQQCKIAAHNALFYVEKLLMPFNLSPFYPFPAIENLDSASYWLPGAAFLIVISLTTLALAFTSSVVPLICWSIYLISLLPASGIIHVGSAVAADRYTYLPHLSITLGLVVGAGQLIQRWPASRSLVIGLAGFWILSLGALSYQQVKFWASPVHMWTRVLQVNPDTALAHRNISTAYYLKGEYGLAVGHLEYLANQGWPVARELTAAYLGTGDCAAARRVFTSITPRNPTDASDLEEVSETIEDCSQASRSPGPENRY